MTGAAKGYITIGGTGGATTLSYDPMGCSTGTDTFTYTLTDGGGLTDTATVFVTINGPASHPFADGPRPGFVTGSTIGSTTPVRMSWCGLTSGTSVKSYRIYQAKNGGSFKTLIKSTTGTSSTRNLDVSPDAYQFRTKITDKKGHTSTGSGPKFRVVRTQDTSGSIVYSSGWAKSTKGSPSGGSTHATSGTNKTATFTFTGRAFAIVGTQAKKHGELQRLRGRREGDDDQHQVEEDARAEGALRAVHDRRQPHDRDPDLRQRSRGPGRHPLDRAALAPTGARRRTTRNTVDPPPSPFRIRGGLWYSPAR